MNRLLTEQAELLAQLEALRQLHRQLKKLNHPNRDCWLAAITRMGVGIQRRIESNMEHLIWGDYDASHN